jgi:hypothetical protein
MTGHERLEHLERAVGALGDRLQGIHTDDRFRAMQPDLAPFVERFRAEQSAARAAHAAAHPKPADLRERYRPVTSDWVPGA